MAEPNVKSRTLFTGDNLDVLRGMNSESVDLIYLDPPFNSNRTYEAPIGSQAAGAAFKDTWTLSNTPRSKGGTDHLDNLQLLCSACNSSKGTISQAAFIAKLKRDGIRE